ncbi:hypothetical protein RRG08_065814 [Elysia crispata]|uniref:Uncharacterized protein n=1 Tax=Elysia crispata TaxID=231223 RepID=A0AAE0YI09_9GAST|nr:hypothetical protein RRG08_065814 [Elysia crispata]
MMQIVMQLKSYVAKLSRANVFEQYNNFDFTAAEDKKGYGTVVKFERHYLGIKRTVFSRYQFWTCMREGGKQSEDFINHLQRFTRQWDFAEMDNMVRDKIVFPVRENPFKGRQPDSPEG